jgi:hypothetical protein
MIMNWLAARKKLATVALAIAAISTAAMAAAPAAEASGPEMTKSTWLETSPGGFPDYWLTSKTPVEMICWTRGPNTDNTQKWFYIESENSPHPYGYVPATTVNPQIAVPLCG